MKTLGEMLQEAGKIADAILEQRRKKRINFFKIKQPAFSEKNAVRIPGNQKHEAPRINP